MACFRPLYGWQKEKGEPLHFGAERPNTRRVDIPCGYCLGCRLQKSKAWAIRCMHETQMHEQNCFITLTYDEQHYTPGLHYPDFKKFIRRVVTKKGPTRFFMCGEYGDRFKRPHYHAILFGQNFTDAKHTKGAGSKELDELWGLGQTAVDQATFDSAAYVARYAIKKVYGTRASDYYTRVDLHTGEYCKVRPEFCQMSRKPGIGRTFIEKYWPEIYLARDGVITKGGRKQKAPRYYDTWLEQHNWKIREEKEYERYIEMKKLDKDNTDERLKTRELIAVENIKRKQRSLE